jgi:hypothetical protein
MMTRVFRAPGGSRAEIGSQGAGFVQSDPGPALKEALP